MFCVVLIFQEFYGNDYSVLKCIRRTALCQLCYGLEKPLLESTQASMINEHFLRFFL